MNDRRNPRALDPLDETQPSSQAPRYLDEIPFSQRHDPLSDFQPIPLQRRWRPKKQHFWLAAALLLAGYFFFPGRTLILILGIDRAPAGTAVGRSDTNILVAVHPLPGTVRAVSIPRDLWVPIPGYGENRINAAHAFGEGQQAGYGPALAMETVSLNFGLQVDDYVRLQLEALPAAVDALGGIDIHLPQAIGGLPAGSHHLNGEQTLAFVRDRSGSDDFSRMVQGQVFLQSLLDSLFQPKVWPRLPGFVIALLQVVDTDVPVWQWPRLGAAVLRAGVDGLVFESIGREMITPWVTEGGAQVLLPDWNQILPFVETNLQ